MGSKFFVINSLLLIVFLGLSAPVFGNILVQDTKLEYLNDTGSYSGDYTTASCFRTTYYFYANETDIDKLIDFSNDTLTTNADGEQQDSVETQMNINLGRLSLLSSYFERKTENYFANKMTDTSSPSNGSWTLTMSNCESIHNMFTTYTGVVKTCVYTGESSN